MTASIPRRLNSIKKLTRTYYHLDYGAPIEKHTELLRVFDVRGSKHQSHPHKSVRVYISRKSLKHFVESRKKDFLIRHTQEETMDMIGFAIDRLQVTITDFDTYEIDARDNESKFFFTKDFSSQGRPLLRVLLHLKKGRMEVCSIHFKTRSKENKNTLN